MRRHGKILERTKYTANEIIEHENNAEIVLYEGENTECARAIIDLADLEQVEEHKWHMARRSNTSYVEATINRKPILLHTFIMGKRPGFIVDHKNGNGLDNRRSNLRHITQAANVLNRNKGFAKSGRIGVFWRADRNGWYAQIRSGSKATVRSFKSLEDAVAWREAMERELVGITASELKAA